MIMKFLNRDFDQSFIWIDLTAINGIAVDSNPWEADLMLSTSDGVMVRIIPLNDSETFEEGLQRLLDAWQSARAKAQNPLIIAGPR